MQADTYRCSLETTEAGSAPKRARVAPLQESIRAQVGWDRPVGLGVPSPAPALQCRAELLGLERILPSSDLPLASLGE